MFDIQLKKTARLPNVYVESVECTELGRRQQRLGCAIFLNKYDSKIIYVHIDYSILMSLKSSDLFFKEKRELRLMN